jgi:hypothetical protein
MANVRALLYRKRIIRRKVDLNAVGEVLRPHRIWSSLPNLARATLLNTASEAAGEVAVAREKGQHEIIYNVIIIIIIIKIIIIIYDSASRARPSAPPLPQPFDRRRLRPRSDDTTRFLRRP